MLSQLGHLPMDFLLLAAAVTLASFGFIAGRLRAEQFSFTGDIHPNSRPNAHGYFVLMWSLVPVVLIGLGYVLFGEGASRAILRSELPEGFSILSPGELTTYLDTVARAARMPDFLSGERVFDTVTERYGEIRGTVNMATLLAACALSVAGMFAARRCLSPGFRARQHVESGIEWFLFLCAALAIATTVGIVASLVFESLRFFAEVPVWDFVLGTRWNAQTNAEFGALPLFFGTFMISFFAMMIAAPVGLYAAIYLSEYATPRVRAIAKPMLEILAGIPTIVYGLFALLTVGPLLLKVFGDDGLGWMQAGTAVMTAGLVMGIMLIPFVSSLSDDIINAVPQAMRDGSYGLGATRSETIKQVVMPAALPGIVGAILLAASRAIGETMIVVLGAGAAAKLSLNPFEAMTTVTAKIVSQLTGDADFSSPEALVAFALGVTLFVITLGLNVLALYIVRKYREQYE